MRGGQEGGEGVERGKEGMDDMDSEKENKRDCEGGAGGDEEKNVERGFWRQQKDEGYESIAIGAAKDRA